MAVWPVDFSIFSMDGVVQLDAVKGSGRALRWVGSIHSANMCNTNEYKAQKRMRKRRFKNNSKTMISISLCKTQSFSKRVSSV